MQDHDADRALPAKGAQQGLLVVDRNWHSCFAARAAWEHDPSQFLGCPRLPGYQDQQQGRNLLVYPVQARSAPALRQGRSVPSMLGMTVQTRQQEVQQVRSVPRASFYVVEVVHEREPTPAPVNPALQAGVDIGLNNLATLTSDKAGFVPRVRVVNGRPVKSIHECYTKRRAELQSQVGERHTSRRLQRLPTKRTRRIDHYLHTASRRIMDLLVAEGIGTLVIGKNDGWKQEIALGRRTNQNFVNVPHARFIDLLTYTAQLVGIQVIVTEERYTSQASFLDADPLPVYGTTPLPAFSGRRIKRGLYRAADGTPINADQRRCQWRLQHPAQSSSPGVRARE